MRYSPERKEAVLRKMLPPRLVVFKGFSQAGNRVGIASCGSLRIIQTKILLCSPFVHGMRSSKLLGYGSSPVPAQKCKFAFIDTFLIIND